MSRSNWKGPYLDQTIVKKNKNVIHPIKIRPLAESIRGPGFNSVDGINVNGVKTSYRGFCLVDQVKTQNFLSGINLTSTKWPTFNQHKNSSRIGSIFYKSRLSNNLDISIPSWKVNSPINRNAIIFPLLCGNTYKISAGNKIVDLNIHEELVGHRFGEFAWTKKIPDFKNKRKKKKNVVKKK
jgi:ribosomal protein S19